MRTFLAAVPLDRARVVVVGDGEAALAKLRLFLNSPADLVWVAPGGPPEAKTVPRDAPSPIVRPAEPGSAGPQVVVLAAGMGTRLGRKLPKPLTPLMDGRSIMQQQLDGVRAVFGDATPVTAVVGRDNIVGTQFHPEKSQAVGLRLIANFLRWNP